MTDWPVLSGADVAAFAQQNLLQTLKQDIDGEIACTGVQQWKKGADVASAAALVLGNDGNYFDITGVVGITSISQLAVGGMAVQPGTVIKLHFDGICIITHHATDLILPGGTSITTAAGDELEFINYAAGDWRCTKRISKGSIYEEGTWTPAVTSGTGAITTVGAVSGYYTKIGRIITYLFDIVITTNGTGATSIKVAGFPVAIPTYLAGCGVELQVTGKQLKVEYIDAATMSVKNYDNSYPAANGVHMVGSVTYFV